MFRTLIIAGVLGLGVVGCQSMGTDSSTASASDAQGVSCAKCQVTWVKVPQTAKGRIVGYYNKKSMECPECRSAVENFFATGKLEHACKVCGPDAMEICKTH